jgi:dihydroorotate dehydrogenase
MDTLIKFRNWLSEKKYKWIWKPIFFKFDPEGVHDGMSAFLRFCGKFGLTRALSRIFFGYTNPALEQSILGIKFKNPVGLSAGFDKNAELTSIIPCLGFGFMEVGSITAQAYGGNPKPRLYRLPAAQSLRINYGLKNLGAAVLYKQLKNRKLYSPVGINIAKTNNPATSDVKKGIEDYFFSYKTFQDVGSFYTINISCPNTCEEKPIFAEPENLDLLLAKIFSIPKTKPVFVKLSPDLPETQLNGILDVCAKHPVDGFVCTNLTKVNVLGHQGKGGFSGKLDDELSLKTIRYVYKKFGSKFVIIGCGGIFSAEDAYKKIKAGASLVELITGMIYEGPQLISDINLGLVRLLQQNGYKNISEAVGKE